MNSEMKLFCIEVEDKWLGKDIGQLQSLFDTQPKGSRSTSGVPSKTSGALGGEHNLVKEAEMCTP